MYIPEVIYKRRVILPLLLFIVGLLISTIEAGFTKDYDRYHWLILAPIIFPIVAGYFAIIGIWKTKSYERLAAVLLLLANLGLAFVIFITYAFSYWQF